MDDDGGSSRKRKGGAEKAREKKRKLLAAEAKSCKFTLSAFCTEKPLQLGEEDSACSARLLDPEDKVEHQPGHDTEHKDRDEHDVESDGNEHDEDEPREIVSLSSEDVQITPIAIPTEENTVRATELVADDQYFTKPQREDFGAFFNVHPLQPDKLEDEKGAFNSHSVFFRKDDTNRRWLTFCKKDQTLFCSVCLAFAADRKSPFVTGMSNLMRKNIVSRIDTHESSAEHRRTVDAYFTWAKSTDIVSCLFRSHKSEHNRKVERYRKVLEREIDVLKLIGKRGLSYRGKRHENSKSLSLRNVDRGNFLEIMLLFSKYDAVLMEHIEDVRNRNVVTKGRGSHVTLLSKTTVNTLLDIIRDCIQEKIAADLRDAQMYSIEIDTTQDIAVEDQCSIVVRYVTETVHERVIAMKKCVSTTGSTMWETVSVCLQNAGVQKEKIVGTATDGASNMRGQYNGFIAHVQDHSPSQVFVWCYAHVLNLVIGDSTQCVASVNLFSLLNLCGAFLRESHSRMDVWREECPGSRKVGMIGATRWWSKHNALTKVFGAYGDTSDALYVELIKTLSRLEEQLTGEARLKASTYRQKLMSFELIICAHVFLRIFSVTSPLSRYLQTSGMDLLKAHQMVTKSMKQLQDMSRDFSDVKAKTEEFIRWANNKLEEDDLDEVQEDFKDTRSRRRKQLACEKAKDTVLSPEEKFKIEVHNHVFDLVILGLSERFEKHAKLFADLACLDPKNFDATRELKKEAFVSISEKLVAFCPSATPSQIKEELQDFADKWGSVKGSLPVIYQTTIPPTGDDDDDEEVQTAALQHQERSGDEDNVTNVIEDHELSDELCKGGESGKSGKQYECCKNCAACCYMFLKRYNMYSSAYSSLFACYKYLLTLPISQVACERCFSKLRFIKSRLRSSMCQDRLEAFMLMSMESDILDAIPSDVIIDRLSKTSKLMSHLLNYV